MAFRSYIGSKIVFCSRTVVHGFEIAWTLLFVKQRSTSADDVHVGRARAPYAVQRLHRRRFLGCPCAIPRRMQDGSQLANGVDVVRARAPDAKQGIDRAARLLREGTITRRMQDEPIAADGVNVRSAGSPD